MRYIIIIFASAVLLSGCHSTKKIADKSIIGIQQTATPVEQSKTAEPFDFSKPETYILGYFDVNRLKQEPYSSWFYKGYDEYNLNSDPLNKLFDIPKDNITIKVVMGTWCPDSRREVPRLMRILDTWHFPAEKVTFIGVDHEKQSPIGDFSSLDIQRVPTIIFYKNNVEAGRIIEKPATSLEQDMENILSRNEKQ